MYVIRRWVLNAVFTISLLGFALLFWYRYDNEGALRVIYSLSAVWLSIRIGCRYVPRRTYIEAAKTYNKYVEDQISQ